VLPGTARVKTSSTHDERQSSSGTSGSTSISTTFGAPAANAPASPGWISSGVVMRRWGRP
jgi:hypothetical protein